MARFIPTSRRPASCKQDVFVAEIYLDRLYQHDLRQVRYEALPRFPAVERDFSFVFDDGVEFEKIHQSVTALGIAELRSFVPVEIFRGEKVGAGKYSILMRAKFQSASARCATTRWRSGRGRSRRHWKRWAACRGRRASLPHYPTRQVLQAITGSPSSESFLIPAIVRRP